MGVVDIRTTMTATELAAALHKDIAAIHRLAYRKGWRRTNTRPVRYLIEDVMESMAIPVVNAP